MIKSIYNTLESRLPKYRATLYGPSERGIMASIMGVVVIAVLFAMYSWSVGPTAPKELNPKPPARPTRIAPPPESSSGSYATHPGAWSPRVPDYEDEATYGYLPGYKATVGLRNPGGGRISRERGQKVYLRNCMPCHLANGSSNPMLRMPARDLSNSHGFQYGSADAAIFRSIKYGIPGASMGRFQETMSDNEIWDVVNYVKGLR